jgi:RNA polymerase sigma-70 factor (ECF subfamily)
LLALMLYCEARRPARRTADGHYVPMSEQAVQLWSAPMLAEAERELAGAAAQQRPGRFQLEAALQSAHVEGARRRRTDWSAIAVLYEGLVRASPTVGACVGRAAAIAEAQSPAAGLTALDGIDTAATKCYQPYWAARAHLLHRAGRSSEALDAFDRAIGLTEDGATRQFLLRRRAEASGRAATQGHVRATASGS